MICEPEKRSPNLGKTRKDQAMPNFRTYCSPTGTENEVAPIQKPNGPEQGYGACWESGCNCKEYKGRGNTCENCGHHFDKHR